jgi:hypothetical protein
MQEETRGGPQAGVQPAVFPKLSVPLWPVTLRHLK